MNKERAHHTNDIRKQFAEMDRRHHKERSCNQKGCNSFTVKPSGSIEFTCPACGHVEPSHPLIKEED